EARAAARLHHPNIAVVHDVDPDAGWLVMELVEGRSLRVELEQGPLAPALVARIAAQMFAALAAAHEAGIIHRDVKPSNIMLGPDRSVKLVDFGVARLVDTDVVDTGGQVGTPAYMAPEQVRGGAIDGRTDLYGAGATLYELVVGERMVAFETPTAAMLDKLARACAAEPALVHAIERCLQADPDARFPSARDALDALSRVERRWSPRWLVVALLVVLVSALAGYAVGHRRHARDPRVDRAFLLAQRGENDKALQILADYLAEHPDDPDAQTIAFLATWWQGGSMEAIEQKVEKLPLKPAQRAMVEGIVLITQRRDAEAIAYLENAERETPGTVEIAYALGEARWHGQHIEDGATMLAQAFARDPRWQMALHHVLEYRLSRGEIAALAPIAYALRAVDPASAAALDCDIAIGERDYARAIDAAKLELARTDLDKIPELYVCLAQAQALAGDYDGGTATAKIAFDLWPLETHDRGGFGQYAEFLLYRGQLDAYLDLTRGKNSSQRAIALLIQRPSEPVDEPQPAWPAKRMAPLGAATWLLQQHVHHADATSVWTAYPEPEIRAWGAALAAEDRGDRDEAVAQLRRALAVPAKGDIRMLVAHELARLSREAGDAAGAAAACDEIVRPRFYLDYRAVLLPDCISAPASR
ncbi:MAG TPA: protein kinase, partial [Kofleriaceae bacterium]